MSSIQTKSIFVSVGDISADLHTARVVEAIKKTNPDIQFWGLGGSSMKEQGVELLYNVEELTCFGIFEVMKFYPKLLKIRKKILEEISLRKPDMVLLVDYGGFNLRISTTIKKRFPDLPITYLISPQVWGSRPWRIKTVAANISKMLVIFPFEETLYKKHNVPVKFVGHPIIEKVDANRENDLEAFCAKYSLNKNEPIVGIFPGSRKQEITDFMPVLGQAMKWLHLRRPNIQFLISCAPHLVDTINEAIERLKMTHIIGDYVKLVPNNDNYALMQAANLLWVKSGTTTLEATLMEKPMLIYYRAMWLSYLLFLLFKRVKYVGWPNLLAGSYIIPELIQLDCRAETLVRYTEDWLDVPGNLEQIKNKLKLIRKRLSNEPFAGTAADEIMAVLNTKAIKEAIN